MKNSHSLYIATLFTEALESEGIPPTTAAMKAQERKKDIGRVEGALEALGIPFKHHKVGTSAQLSEAEVKALLALLPSALPSRAQLDLHAAES
jgi:hypothetical protein